MEESELFPEVALQRKQVWEPRNIKTISNSKKIAQKFKNKFYETRKGKKGNLTRPTRLAKESSKKLVV